VTRFQALSLVGAVSGAFVLALLSCGDGGSGEAPKRSSGGSSSSSASIVSPTVLSVFGALPAHYHQGEKPSGALTDLGRTLYYEARLSKSGTISCNSCHQLDRFGVDGEKTSPGHDGTRGERNSPTSYNAAGHFVQFWDGRAADVEEQAKGPVLNPIEHGLESADQLVGILKGIPGYTELFQKAFPGQAEPITFDNFAVAVGAFERGLVTPSRFDDFLAGKKDALSYQEQMGLKAFYDTGCHTCHMGPHLGASSYDKLGKVIPWPGEVKDLGRGAHTKNASENLMFKVPTLRNVTKTAPYLHDGSVADLPEIVRLMAKHQLGKDLAKSDVDAIVAFLGALEGRVDAAYVKKPQMP
jgi:cytochrome c peroxidase